MNLGIFQIYYDDFSKSKLDPAFIPYDNTKGYAKWFEYGVFRDNFYNQNYKSFDYTGFVSWKFTEKTRIANTNEFISFIKQNEGYDVYFINPFQGLTNRFKNVWDCGEYFHPGLKEIVKYILKKINYDIDLEKIINTHENTLYCNYWVGNEKFWNKYIQFSEPIYSYIENSKDPFLENKILQRADHTINASFIPFIMERIFSTIVFLEKKSINALPFKFRPLFNYSIVVSPIYFKLDRLKLLELNGKDVQENRDKLLPFLEEYTQMALKERTNGSGRQILSRIIFMIRIIINFLNPLS